MHVATLARSARAVIGGEAQNWMGFSVRDLVRAIPREAGLSLRARKAGYCTSAKSRQRVCRSM